MQCLGRTQTLKRCKNQASFLVCHHHRYQPWIAAFSLLGFVGLIAGLYQDAWKPLFDAESQVEDTRERLIGRLEVAHNAMQETVGALSIRLETEEMAAELQNAGDSITFPSPPLLPRALEELASDAEAYQLLSESFKSRFSYFVKVRESYLRGYALGVRRGHAQPGSIKMMLEEYRAQEECIELELRIQRGSLDADSHRSLFNAALRNQVIRVLGTDTNLDDLPVDVRLGDPTVMMIPE